MRPEWGRGAGNFPLERQGKNDPLDQLEGSEKVTGVHGAGEQTGDCGSVREPESAERNRVSRVVCSRERRAEEH